MQIDLQTNEHLVNVLHGAENVAIMPVKAGGVDAFCAALALHLMIRGLEKSSKILYPGSIPELCKEHVSDQDLVSTFSQRQLTISIDYSGEHNAKAWYEPEGEMLKVKLAPVSKDFDPALRVRTRLDTGFNFDTAIVLGAQELEDLGYVLNEVQQELAKSTIVNLSNSGKNNRFGSVNVIDPLCDSICQLVIKKAPLWELNITTQVAQVLLLGITNK